LVLVLLLAASPRHCAAARPVGSAFPATPARARQALQRVLHTEAQADNSSTVLPTTNSQDAFSLANQGRPPPHHQPPAQQHRQLLQQASAPAQLDPDPFQSFDSKEECLAVLAHYGLVTLGHGQGQLGIAVSPQVSPSMIPQHHHA